MKKILIMLSSILLFHVLFWKSSQGINILLLTWMLTGGVFITKRYVFEREEVKILLTLWNIIALLVVVHGSLLSLIVYWGIFCVCIGLLQKRRVLFWGFAILEGLRALFVGWIIDRRLSSWKVPEIIPVLKQLKRAKLALIPLLIIVPFYAIYAQANSDFAIISHRFWANFFSIFEFNVNKRRLGHFILSGILIVAVLGQRSGTAIFQKIAKNWEFDLKRIRKTKTFTYRTLALKSEYQIGILSFISLNVLLLFVNVLDVVTVWFSFTERTASQLSEYVHQGTYLLIFSILLAMGVVVGFLRKNLNFYKNNKLLLQLVYIWLAQNAFLALSVAVRNGHYINKYGLAAGRIEVMFFLLLVLFGLFSLYQKVKSKKTVFYLVQQNGWAFMVILVLAATVNWDAAITRYNLKHHPGDTAYLIVRLDNNLLPLLKETQKESPVILLSEVAYKAKQHARQWEKTDWRSWTWSGYRQYKAWKALE